MKIIDRYIGHAVLSATLTVLLVLLAIFTFFAFIEELETIGIGSYGVVEVAVVVSLGVPRLAYDLFPIAALIGALLALGGLMESNEIPIVRCAGVSKTRMMWSVMKAGFVFVFFAIVIGELIFPPAEKLARELRSMAVNERVTMKSKNGFWARDGDSYVNIREVLPNDELRDIAIYEFEADDRLRMATHAESAHYEDGRWELRGIKQTRVRSRATESRSIQRAEWDSVLQPDLIAMVAINPDSLSMIDLSRYVDFIETNGQNAQAYEHALWIKIGYPFATAVMVFLAIPLVLRSTRTVSMGRRIMFGAVIGLIFHVFNQASGHLGVVFGVPAVFSALGPTLCVLLVGILLNFRTA